VTASSDFDAHDKAHLGASSSPSIAPSGFFDMLGRLIRALDQFPTPEAFDAMMGELEASLARGPGATTSPKPSTEVQLDELLLEKLFHRWRHKGP
jgi:hypothetical protein